MSRTTTLRTTAAAAVGASALLLSGLSLAPANAATDIHEYPETPAFNANLPIVKTTHKSDHLKANVLNPRPVCNASEDRRTTVYKVTDSFLPVGTVSTTNNTKNPIPLTQNTSKSQSISLEVNGSKSQSMDVNLGGSQSQDKTTTNAGIAFSLAKTIGGSASYSLSWQVGQTIGPYDVPAGYTGDATYGFRAITMTGTQQFCLANGTWSTPTAWSAFAPIKNEVRVKLYNNAADSDQSGKPGAGDRPVNKELEADLEPKLPINPKPAKPAKLDLEPKLTVSDAKAVGFAGSVALKIKNAGTERYYSESPSVTYRVDVKTEDGPKGVDRLITTTQYKGAHVRDLGFNTKTSTRSFLVTLSNPIKAGEQQHVATFSFGDGKTSEGRLKNSIEVTQIKGAKGDKSTWNDQGVSSKDITLNDGGKPAKSKGIF